MHGASYITNDHMPSEPQCPSFPDTHCCCCCPQDEYPLTNHDSKAVALVTSWPLPDGTPGAVVCLAVDPVVAGTNRNAGLALHWSGAADMTGARGELPHGWVTDPEVTWDAGGCPAAGCVQRACSASGCRLLLGE